MVEDFFQRKEFVQFFYKKEACYAIIFCFSFLRINDMLTNDNVRSYFRPILDYSLWKKNKISRAIQESNDHDEFGQTFISRADIFQCSVKENAT